MATSTVQRLSMEDQQPFSLCNPPVRSSFEFLPVRGPPMCFADVIFSSGHFLPSAPKAPSDELNRQEQKKSLILSDHRRKSLDGRLTKSKSCGGANNPIKRKPKWYVLAFGSIRWPPEMHVRDMRGRLKNLRSESNGKSLNSGGTWKLIRSLSCRADIGGVADDDTLVA